MTTLHHLIYLSKSQNEMSNEEVEELTKQARFNNLIYKVTGLLLYGEQQFIQVLEGKKENIEIIFEKILVDKRHQNIQVLSLEPIEERAFSNWNMGLVILSKYPDIKEKLLAQCARDIEYNTVFEYQAPMLVDAFSHENFIKYIS